MKDIKTTDDYNKAIKNTNVVVDFGATWCGPCNKLEKPLLELSKNYPNVHFFKINVDDLSNIDLPLVEPNTIPCLVYIKNNIELGRTNGNDIKVIEAAVKKYFT